MTRTPARAFSISGFVFITGECNGNKRKGRGDRKSFCRPVFSYTRKYVTLHISVRNESDRSSGYEQLSGICDRRLSSGKHFICLCASEADPPYRYPGDVGGRQSRDLQCVPVRRCDLWNLCAAAGTFEGIFSGVAVRADRRVCNPCGLQQ